MRTRLKSLWDNCLSRRSSTCKSRLSSITLLPVFSCTVFEQSIQVQTSLAVASKLGRSDSSTSKVILHKIADLSLRCCRRRSTSEAVVSCMIWPKISVQLWATSRIFWRSPRAVFLIFGLKVSDSIRSVMVVNSSSALSLFQLGLTDSTFLSSMLSSSWQKASSSHSVWETLYGELLYDPACHAASLKRMYTSSALNCRFGAPNSRLMLSHCVRSPSARNDPKLTNSGRLNSAEQDLCSRYHVILRVRSYVYSILLDCYKVLMEVVWCIEHKYWE